MVNDISKVESDDFSQAVSYTVLSARLNIPRNLKATYIRTAGCEIELGSSAFAIERRRLKDVNC